MQEYGKTIITDVGRKMLTEVDGAKGKITYTRAALYAEDINQLSDADRVALTALTGELISTDLVVKEIRDTTVNVGASFNNAEVSKDLKFNSIGWFAKTSVDDTEKLLATTPSSTEQTLVAGNKGATTTSLDIDCLFARSHDTTVIIQTSPVGLVNGTQLTAEINKAKDEINKELPSIAKQAIDAANDDVNKLKALVNSNNIINNQKIDVDAFTQVGISKFNDCQLVSIGLTPDDNSHNGWIFNIPEKDGSLCYQQIVYINGKGVFYRTVADAKNVVEKFDRLTSESDLEIIEDAIKKAGQIKQISVNSGTPVGPDASGKVNLDIPKPDMSKYVQSIGGNKPDSITGDVPIVTKTYTNIAIEPNTFIKPGVYKLINCSYLYVNIAGFAKTDLLNGYLIVNKGKTDNDVFQYLITDSNNIVKINMRKVNPKDYVYPDFRRLTDDSDYAQIINNIFPIAFEHPLRYYAKNEVADIDKITENGIYHFMDAKVIASIKTDALNGLPRTTDGTTMCGYLFVMKHDDYNREQVLLLNSGENTVVAIRVISGINSWRPIFRRLLNIDDFNLLWNRISTVDNKELVHQCDDLATGITYSKAHPNVFVATS